MTISADPKTIASANLVPDARSPARRLEGPIVARHERIPVTTRYDSVRIEDVPFGWPRQWRRRDGAARKLHPRLDLSASTR